MEILAPGDERLPASRRGATRLTELTGMVIGLLDISKARGDVFLDRLEEKILGAGAHVKRFRKPTFTKPAPVDLRQEIATQCDAVVEALAD